MLEFDRRFVRKPFVVEAFVVTDENMQELADLIGKVQYDNDSGNPYILVDPKVVQNVTKVFSGYIVTRVSENEKIHCYAPGIFEKLFVESTVEIENWVNYVTGRPSLIAPEVPNEEVYSSST